MDGGGDNGGNWSPKTAASGDWTGWDYWDGDAFEV
jgi:hypothetical protein